MSTPETKYVLRIGKTVRVEEMELESIADRVPYDYKWKWRVPATMSVEGRFEDSVVFNTRAEAEHAARERLAGRRERLRKQLAACDRMLAEVE